MKNRVSVAALGINVGLLVGLLVAGPLVGRGEGLGVVGCGTGA